MKYKNTPVDSNSKLGLIDLPFAEDFHLLIEISRYLLLNKDININIS